MARRIAGYSDVDLTVFDLSPAAMARIDFARKASSAAAAIRGANVVMTMLPADQHVAAVADVVGRVGEPGQVFADFSTISPDAIDRVQRQLGDVGVDVVGATCMKSVAAARDGTLTLFVGGPSRDLELLRPLLDAMSAAHYSLHSAAAAKSAKIVNNLIVASIDYALCEAILIGLQLGQRPDESVELFIAAGADSWPLRNHIVRHALPGDVGKGIFSVAYMAKDLSLAAALAGSRQRPSFYADLVLGAYRGLVAHGHGDDYHPVVLRWLQDGANVPELTVPVNAVSREDEARALGSAVVAVQTLATFEAMRLAVDTETGVRELSTLLAGASADNATLRRLMASTPSTTWPTLADLKDDLDGALSLAERARTPAFAFAVGRNIILSLMDRASASASVLEAFSLANRSEEQELRSKS